MEETLTRARETFIPLMKRNLLFWIPTQFAVFGFVEENLQIPILIVCGLVWTIILSISAGNASEEQQPPAVAELAEGDIVENRMAQLGAVEAAMGLNGTSFYYAANISTYYEEEGVDVLLDDVPIRTIPNTPNKATTTSEQQQVPK
jgi:Mpv17 / PMP22 family